jgi:surface polysaccharide O-acyltransferase-like enzyme
MASNVVVPSEKMNQADALRVWGAIAVVLIHVSVQGELTPESVHSGLWWVCNIINSLCRWAVPVFVMLSGALLLPPKDETISSFYKKRAKRVLYPLFFWSIFYVLFNNRPTDLGALSLMKHFVIVFLTSRPYYHLYFLFITVGLYLFVPIFRVITAHTDRQMLSTMAAIALGIASVEAAWRATTNDELNAFSRFVPYIGYFFLGFLLRNASLNAAKMRLYGVYFLSSVTVTAVVGAIGIARWGADKKAFYIYDNFSPTTIVMSVCVFLFFSTIASKTSPILNLNKPAYDWLSKTTFGVYVIHPFFLVLLLRYNICQPQTPSYLLVCTVLVTAASLLTTLILQRIPLLKEFV